MKKIIFLSVLISTHILSSYSQEKKWIDFNQNGKKDLFVDPEACIDNRVNDLLSQMTTSEKILLLREVSPEIPGWE